MFSEIKRVEPNGQLVDKAYPNFSQIIENGMSSCEEYATVFQAIANYKGIPTVAVIGTEIPHVEQIQKSLREGNIKIHVFVEAFVDGKWILLDTTSTNVDTDYDKDDKNIITSVAPYYVMWKRPTCEGMWNSNHFVNLSDITNYYLDLSLVSDTSNKTVERR